MADARSILKKIIEDMSRDGYVDLHSYGSDGCILTLDGAVDLDSNEAAIIEELLRHA